MKPSLVLGSLAVVLGAVAGLGYRFLVPKIGHASRAEIEAALPASMRVEDAPDPAGETRYARLFELLGGLDPGPAKAKDAEGRSTAGNERVLADVEALIAEGPLWAPRRTLSDAFPEMTAVRNGAKAFSYAAEKARKHGDRAACGRWTVAGLRYADALSASGGVVIDELVHTAIRAIALRTAYLAEIGGGLDEGGRAALLDRLTPQDGASPTMADALRRDFQQYLLPTIVDPQAHRQELIDGAKPADPDDDSSPPPAPLVGTFDPVETARLSGAIYAVMADDLRRPYRLERHGERLLIDAAQRDLPQPPKVADGEERPRGWDAYRYRLRMNSGKNTLGRMVACRTVLSSLGDLAGREAANRNLLRAVILLREGKAADVLDPFDGKRLRFDPKRKLVWSVGQNGKDDGGKIGKGDDNFSPDLGYPYGDGAWEALHPAPKGFGLKGRIPGGPPG